MRREVELHIEKLVLHGFARGDRYRIAQAIQHELMRLFGDASVPFLQSGESPRLDGGVFQISHGATAQSIGVEIGRAIYQSFGGGKQTR